MTTRALVGSSMATLQPHPRGLRIECRALEHGRGAALALNEHLEAASRRRELRVDTGEGETPRDAVPVGAGGGNSDAPIGAEHGFAAARIRVGGINRRVHDLERP